MKRFLILTVVLAGLAGLYGCSDSNGPTGPAPGSSVAFTDTSVFDSATGIWTSSIDASSHDSAAYFSYNAAMTSGKPAGATWDIKFQRSNVNLNGGSSAEGGGMVKGYDLGTARPFDSVTMADMVPDSDLVTDAFQPVIDEWYIYNPVTHQLDMTGNVYTMVDASGQHFLKFHVDSLVGAGMPPDMGTAWISYYYQPMMNSTMMNGMIQIAAITVGSGTGYFDFSTGNQVTPSDPANSTDWDISISDYEVRQNSGPNGIGNCATFQAYTQMSDPTDLAGLTEHPAGSPMFPDFISSIFNGSLTDDAQLWYDYDGTTHTLSSKSHVYLVKTDDSTVFKMQIDGYYADIAGNIESGYYTFRWKKL